MEFYAAFSVQEDMGRPLVLRSAIDLVWRFVDGEPIVAGSAEAAVADVGRELPDPEGTWNSPFVGMARDACDVVCAALDIVMSARYEDAVSAAFISQQALVSYLALVIDPLYEKATIEQYSASEFKYTELPLFKRELEKQERDLDLLSRDDLADELAFRLTRSDAVIGAAPVRRLALG